MFGDTLNIHSASKFRCGDPPSDQDDPEVVQKATNTKGKGFWGDVWQTPLDHGNPSYPPE